jgi:hypothetical protein
MVTGYAHTAARAKCALAGVSVMTSTLTTATAVDAVPRDDMASRASSPTPSGRKKEDGNDSGRHHIQDNRSDGWNSGMRSSSAVRTRRINDTERRRAEYST